MTPAWSSPSTTGPRDHLSLERIREITGGAADYAIECAGVIAVLEEAIEAVLTLE